MMGIIPSVYQGTYLPCRPDYPSNSGSTISSVQVFTSFWSVPVDPSLNAVTQQEKTIQFYWKFEDWVEREDPTLETVAQRFGVSHRFGGADQLSKVEFAIYPGNIPSSGLNRKSKY